MTTVALHDASNLAKLHPDPEIHAALDGVTAVLSRARLPGTPEKAVQDAIEHVLCAHGIPAEREARLSASDVIDFLTRDGVGIEVKTGGAKRAIYRQLQRYAIHPGVRGIVLVTSVVLGLPERIDGKPAVLLSLGRSWL